MFVALVALLAWLSSAAAQQSDAAGCAPWQTCRDLAVAAADRGDFEAFHTIAWRAVQTGPRNDPELMYLLARAQSLSGRPHDALVMLQRLADRGIARLEAETLEDFRRVRNLPAWPDTLEAMRKAGAPAAVASAQAPQPAAGPPRLPLRAMRLARPAGASARAKSSALFREPISSRPAERSTAAETAPPPTAPAPVTAEKGLSLPDAVVTPIAMAYDAVSARLVIADESSDTLKIVSELSANAVDLVSRGWAGPYHTTAIAIDGRRGDLWVVGANAGAGPSDSVLHRVQLISGRLRYRVPLPADAGAARFGAVALSANGAFVLDVEGKRIFELADGGKALRLKMAVAVDEPAGLAVASDDVAFVSHRAGIMRLDLAQRRGTAVTAAKGMDLTGLQWIEYAGTSLLGIQRRTGGTLAAVRIRLDAAGRRATAVEELGPAASPAATVMNGAFYFVEDRPGGRVVRSIPVR